MNQVVSVSVLFLLALLVLMVLAVILISVCLMKLSALKQEVDKFNYAVSVSTQATASAVRRPAPVSKVQRVNDGRTVTL